MASEKKTSIAKKEYGVWTLLYEPADSERSGRLIRWFDLVMYIAKKTHEAFLHRNSDELPDAKSFGEKVPAKNNLEDSMETSFPNRLRLVSRFMQEVYSLGPTLFYLHIASEALAVVDSTVNLYAANKLLETTSRCLDGSSCRASMLVYVIVLRIVIACTSQFYSDYSSQRTAILSNRVSHHFRLKAIKVAARLDLAARQDPITEAKMASFTSGPSSDSCNAYATFVEIWSVCFSFIRLLSSAILVVGMSQSKTMIALAVILCLLDPLSELLSAANESIYDMSYFYYCAHKGFNKMSRLHNMAYSYSLREDMLNNNSARYIVREYEKEGAALGDTRTDCVEYQWIASLSLWRRIFDKIRHDLPDIAFALVALYRPGGLSIASLVTLKQTSRSINGTVDGIIWQLKAFSSHLTTIDNLYTMEDIENKIKDGVRSYPPINEDFLGSPEKHVSTGAKLEFRNVCFRYPGGDRDALSDVSFTIQPGQLVVIVGVNGSGKSSTVKLLTRLYDPTGGEILLDDHPLPSYKLDDVRRCVAVLRQDHPILPVSLGENVAFGLAERTATDTQIQEAVRQGGAAHLISKQTRGLDTVLDPDDGAWAHILDEEKHRELKEISDAHRKEIRLSGGETQRISASRTFMRLMGGDIRLLVADEPTSALDPEGEFELFTRFREHSGDKTVIFITHRFGHLTRHADLILCFKDGELVESGKHEALLALNGEYKKLHSVQAHAFI